MQYDILCTPTYSLAEITLQDGESIVSDSGAMAWMDTNIEAKTAARGGVMQGIKRQLLAGESFFQNTYTAHGGAGKVALAPGASGDIVSYQMTGGELVLEKGAYLASEAGVSVDSKFDGFKGFFNEGFFVLKCSGTGLLLFHSYGDIQEIDIDGEYIVDNGFAVAWEPQLTYKLTKARKIRSFLFGDQLILRFSGKGKLWVQSRSGRALAAWVHPFRRQKPKND